MLVDMDFPAVGILGALERELNLPTDLLLNVSHKRSTSNSSVFLQWW